LNSSKIRRRGLMLVLSSPSGAGKTSVARALLQRDPALTLSVSATTRKARPGEVDGRDYHFVAEESFKGMMEKDEFLEHAQVFGHYYGTPAKPVMEALEQGRDVLFDVDWQGTQQLRSRAPKDLVSVFLLPPSIEDLEKRLRARAQDSDEVVRGRMAKATSEMSHWAEYDYVIVNRDLEQTIASVQSILLSERHRNQRQEGLFAFVTELCAER
jgi:guanylate kinase